MAGFFAQDFWAQDFWAQDFWAGAAVAEPPAAVETPSAGGVGIGYWRRGDRGRPARTVGQQLPMFPEEHRRRDSAREEEELLLTLLALLDEDY